MLKTPPQTRGVIDAVEQLLTGADVLDFSPNGGLVVAEGDQLDLESDDPIEQPAPASNGFWWRIVLMEVIDGLQGQKQHLDNVRDFKFYVRVDVMPPEDLEDPEFFLEAVHTQVYEELHLKKVSIQGASQLHSVIRKHFPTPMFRDDTKGFRYMTAPYMTILGPTS